MQDQEPLAPTAPRVDHQQGGGTADAAPPTCPGSNSSRAQALVSVAPGVSRWTSVRAAGTRAPLALSPFATLAGVRRGDATAEFDQLQATAGGAGAHTGSGSWLKPKGSGFERTDGTPSGSAGDAPPSTGDAAAYSSGGGAAGSGCSWGRHRQPGGPLAPLALLPGQTSLEDDWWSGVMYTLPEVMRARPAASSTPEHGLSPAPSAPAPSASPLAGPAPEHPAAPDADHPAPAPAVPGGIAAVSEEAAARLRAQLSSTVRLSRFANEEERRDHAQRVRNDLHNIWPNGNITRAPEARRPRGPGINIDPVVGHRHSTAAHGASFPAPPAGRGGGARTTPPLARVSRTGEDERCNSSGSRAASGSEGAASGSNRKRQRGVSYGAGAASDDDDGGNLRAAAAPAHRRSSTAATRTPPTTRPSSPVSAAAELRLRAARGVGGDEDDEEVANSLLQYAQAQWAEASTELSWRKLPEPLPAAFGYAQQAPHALHGLGLRVKALRPSADDLEAAAQLMEPYLPMGAAVTAAPDRTGPIKLIDGGRRGERAQLQLGGPEECLWWAQAMAVGAQHPVYGWAAATTPEAAAGAACARLLTTVFDTPGAIACGAAPHLFHGLLSCGGMEDEVGAVDASSSEDDTEMEEAAGEGEMGEEEMGEGAPPEAGADAAGAAAPEEGPAGGAAGQIGGWAELQPAAAGGGRGEAGVEGDGDQQRMEGGGAAADGGGVIEMVEIKQEPDQGL